MSTESLTQLAPKKVLRILPIGKQQIEAHVFNMLSGRSNSVAEGKVCHSYQSTDRLANCYVVSRNCCAKDSISTSAIILVQVRSSHE